jgi:hypothetical protein
MDIISETETVQRMQSRAVCLLNIIKFSVAEQIRIWDPVLFRPPDHEKNQDPGSEILNNILEQISDSLETILTVLNT